MRKRRDVIPISKPAWFNVIAACVGSPYLRNAFTKRSDRRTRAKAGNMGRGMRAWEGL